MSLYLPEQKLGSHSAPDSTSFKFMLKGRQTGTMHRGHSWVFRAESYETMMAWYEDIESLISKTGEARNAFVRRHVRSVSGASGSSDMDEDEADRIPYSSELAVMSQERPTSEPRQPGGRFPSDVQIDRHAAEALSPSSGESSGEKDLTAATSAPYDARAGPDDRSPSANRSTDDTPRRDSYYGDWMGTGTPTQQSRPARRVEDDHQNLDDNTQDQYAAVVSNTRSGERSTSRQRTRGESVSTVPTTTNVTEHTNHTVSTSADEHENPEPAVVDFGDSRAQPSTDEHGSPMVSAVPEVTEEDRQPKKSLTDLDIPGQYPPNVAA